MTDQDTLAVLAARNDPASGSFGAFISSGEGLLPVANTVQNSAMVKAITRTDTTLPTARAQHIIESIHNVLKSREFIEELSDTIGQLRLNETEDDFVVRCKASMKAIIERKLTSLSQSKYSLLASLVNVPFATTLSQRFSELSQRFSDRHAGDSVRRSNPGSDRLDTDGTMTMGHAYQILGLPPSADPLKVKQVYRDLAEAWHVDTSGITDDERMKELNAAYECLKQAGKAR